MMEPDPELLKMIEEKRKQAIELRKRKMEESQKLLSTQTSNQPVVIQNSPDSPNKISKPVPSNSVPNLSPSKISYPKIPNWRQMAANRDRANYINKYKKPTSNFTTIRDRSPVSVSTQSQQPVENTVSTSSNGKKIVKMSIMLKSETHFQVVMNYEEEIIQVFKKIDSRQWDPVTKKWQFSIRDFSNVMESMKTLPTIKVEYETNIPEKVVQLLSESAGKNKKTVYLSERLEPEFIETLYPYQRQGIIFGVQRDGRCLIADDMGLGKTIQAIGLAKWYREDWPLIIVCPSSLRYQWKSFILKWMPDIKETDIFVSVDIKTVFPRVPITITSYDIMSRMRNRFSVETNRFYKMIIMDESHYIKSDAAQRTSTATLIAQTCQRVLLLSGTPALSRPIELYPQLNIIDKTLFPSKHAFGVRYCDAQQKTIFGRGGRPVTTWNYKGAKNLDELAIILENTIMIRRLKKDVLKELPSKKREMINLSTDGCPQNDLEILNDIRKGITDRKMPKIQKINLVMKYFAKSAAVKVPAVKEFIQDLMEKDIKLICFCHHQIMLDGVQAMLNENKISHIRIDGSTPPKARQEACDVFQKKPSYKVALLSLTACATGLNLTSASMVVFAEPYWNPGLLAQAEDRAHRIGQSSNVRVIYLVARNTIDEMIWPLICKKLDILNRVGLSRDTFDDTHNPLNVEESQTLITEFVNSLSKTDAVATTTSDQQQQESLSLVADGDDLSQSS